MRQRRTHANEPIHLAEEPAQESEQSTWKSRLEKSREDRARGKEDRARETEKIEKLKPIIEANKIIVKANRPIIRANKRIIKANNRIRANKRLTEEQKKIKLLKQKHLQSEKPLQSVWYKAEDSEAHTTEVQKPCFPTLLKRSTKEVEVDFPEAQSINGKKKISHTVPLSHIHLPVSTGWSLWRRRRLTRAEVATPVGLNAQDD